MLVPLPFFSRRGWGEFPIHLTLIFTHPLAKPLSVTHHLRLDKTYTGLQTLGAETVLEVGSLLAFPDFSTRTNPLLRYGCTGSQVMRTRRQKNCSRRSEMREVG